MKGRMGWLDPLGSPTGIAGDHKGKVSRRTKEGAAGRLPAGGSHRREESRPPGSPVTGSQTLPEHPGRGSWLKPLTQTREHRKQKHIKSEQ